MTPLDGPGRGAIVPHSRTSPGSNSDCPQARPPAPEEAPLPTNPDRVDTHPHGGVLPEGRRQDRSRQQRPRAASPLPPGLCLTHLCTKLYRSRGRTSSHCLWKSEADIFFCSVFERFCSLHAAPRHLIRGCRRRGSSYDPFNAPRVSPVIDPLSLTFAVVIREWLEFCDHCRAS